jgi:hypothetical protein
MNLVNTALLDKGWLEALEGGADWIAVTDTITPPIVRLPGMPLEQTLLAVRQENKNGMSGMMGVTDYQRGVIEQKAAFATEVAALTSQSGARGVQAAKEFERFVSRKAQITVLLEKKFGGAEPGDEPEVASTKMELWAKFQDVQEVDVVEASTLYKDPSYDMQQGMQLLQLGMQITPLMIQTGQPPPNLTLLYQDVLRAAGKHDVDKYSMPPMQMPQQGMPPQDGAPPQQ